MLAFLFDSANGAGEKHDPTPCRDGKFIVAHAPDPTCPLYARIVGVWVLPKSRTHPSTLVSPARLKDLPENSANRIDAIEKVSTCISTRTGSASPNRGRRRNLQARGRAGRCG